jgi:uncharacterized protein (TIGR02145 family)
MRSTYLILFILFYLSLNSNSQNLFVNFSSIADSIIIDSISAINLTTNQKVTLAGNATLELDNITAQGIDYKISKPSSIVYPNPYSQNTTLQINSNTAQKISVKITDLSGKILVQTSTKVLSGVQLYSISLKKPGLYIVTLEKSDGVESFKIMQKQVGLNNFSLINSNIPELKSQKSSFKSLFYNKKMASNIPPVSDKMGKSYLMSYKKGDIILFDCRSGIYETIITKSIDSSLTITPEFIKCIDSDNNSYPVVEIGNQIWMAKNLTTTHYNNGDLIPSDIADSVWIKLKTGACAAYLNDPKHIPNYGRLYNWFAADDNRGICPSGWHVASNAEWDTLLNYLGGPQNAGGKLKATGTEFWKEPNFGADNSSGFSALPSSGRNNDGVAYNDGHDCYYWMADEKDSTYAYNRYISYNRILVTKVFHTKKDGFAVRCIKDE